MEMLYNILPVVLLIGLLLVLYFTSSKKEQKDQKIKVPIRKTRTEYESGKEITGVLNEEFSREISPENNSPWIKDRSEPVITTDIDLIGGDIDLPENYIRLFSRDPEYLFTYWQINKELFFNHTFYLRLYNLSNDEYTDIEINEPAGNWYLKIEPDKKYKIAIGYFKKDGFFPVATSGTVHTPPDRPAGIIDKWLVELSEYGLGIEMDSLVISKNIEERKK